MNGVYLRELAPQEFAHRLVLWLGENGYDWDAERVSRAAPLVQEKIARLAEFPGFAGFLFGDVEPDPTDLDGGAPMLAATEEALASLEPFEAAAIETALRATADGLGLKPRQAFQPDSRRGDRLEGLAGPVREHRAARPRDDAQPPPGGGRRRGVRALVGSGFGGASGSSARWNTSHARRRKR